MLFASIPAHAFTRDGSLEPVKLVADTLVLGGKVEDRANGCLAEASTGRNTLATATRTLATVTSTTEYKPQNQVRSLPLTTNANMIPRKSKEGSLDSTHASGGSVTSTPFSSFACVSRLLQAMSIAPM